MKLNKKFAVLAAALGAGLFTVAGPALAEYGLNMPRGASDYSLDVYNLHMLIFWICTVIGVIVFGAIIYSVIKFRRSKGAVAAQFHHSTVVEVIWTIIPMLILIAIAIPSTRVLVDMEDTSHADLTIKVTGYQWRWGYDYLDEGISFISSMDEQSNLARQRNPTIQPRDVENYLLEVDNPVVIPIGKKVRFLLTSNDVIHSWWVPDLGWKRDAIPGFINETWTNVNEPGVFRGQCAELCGRDHAFMPVVVHAVTQDEYDAWVKEQQAKSGAAKTAQPQTQPAQQAPQQAAVAPVEPALEQEQAPAKEPAAAPGNLGKDELMQRGEQAYLANCSSCHMANGEGMPPIFAPLKGGPITTGAVAGHIDIVLHGKPGTAMASFAHLGDEDLAAIITYERNAWGNNTGDLVQPGDVRAAR